MATMHVRWFQAQLQKWLSAQNKSILLTEHLEMRGTGNGQAIFAMHMDQEILILIEGLLDENGFTVAKTVVHPDHINQGLARSAYEAIFQYVPAIHSDSILIPPADRLWHSLIERHPEIHWDGNRFHWEHKA